MHSTSTDLGDSPTDNGQSDPASSAFAERATFWPAPPRTVAATGLLAPFIEDHLLRLLYFGLQMTGAELASACGVPYGTVQPLVHGLTRDQLLEVVGQAALTESGYRYMLAPKGRDEAKLPWSMAWVRHRDKYGT